MVLGTLIGYKCPGNSIDESQIFRTCCVCLLTRGVYKVDITIMGRREVVQRSTTACKSAKLKKQRTYVMRRVQGFGGEA
jgi:hypothetical protein